MLRISCWGLDMVPSTKLTLLTAHPQKPVDQKSNGTKSQTVASATRDARAAQHLLTARQFMATAISPLLEGKRLHVVELPLKQFQPPLVGAGPAKPAEDIGDTPHFLAVGADV